MLVLLTLFHIISVKNNEQASWPSEISGASNQHSTIIEEELRTLILKDKARNDDVLDWIEVSTLTLIKYQSELFTGLSHFVRFRPFKLVFLINMSFFFLTVKLSFLQD